MSEHASKKRGPLTPGGVVICCFGCGAMAIGGWFIYAGMQEHWECAAARAWAPTPCTVVTSRFIDTGGRKSSYLEFSFSYHFSGKDFVSHQYSIQAKPYESRAAAARAHPVGEIATCFVNPADPKRAVIDREVDFKVSLSEIAAASWFSVLGLAVVLIALKTERQSRRRVRMLGHRP
ncbi:MAG TPA: DUF3592 domain-containing protein [Planctomycetaceae bacterium]|jgi:hypothetical protein|nr:DUF3592 domain-containing protein [Planctomycetaceae bacterium]